VAIVILRELRETVILKEPKETVILNEPKASEGSNGSQMTEKQGYVYILTNAHNKVLYTGVTSDLVKRVYEHKNKMVDGFTKKYSVYKLVHFEVFVDMVGAITREKQIKGWLRGKKIALIEGKNPEWKDLYDGLC